MSGTTRLADMIREKDERIATLEAQLQATEQRAEEEREACAALCDERAAAHHCYQQDARTPVQLSEGNWREVEAHETAAAIRARRHADG